MSLDAAIVSFLQRLLKDRPPDRTSKAAHALARSHSLGRVQGSAVIYADHDFRLAEDLLINRGFDLVPRTPGHLRSQAGRGGSEKKGARPVAADWVAVVPLNVHLQVPQETKFLAMEGPKVDLDLYEVLLLVENLEVLGDLKRFRWLDGFVRGRRALAVFRGQPAVFNTAAPAALLRRSTLPVLGFLDFDPASLAIASSEPRLEDLCLPPWEHLETAAKHWGRSDLYFNQVQHARGRLDALPRGGRLRQAWQLLQALERGLDQEQFPQ